MRNNVRDLRTSLGLSQQDLGQALDVSRQTINAIETGKYLPSLPLALSIGRFFSKKVEEVFHDDER